MFYVFCLYFNFDQCVKLFFVNLKALECIG